MPGDTTISSPANFGSSSCVVPTDAEALVGSPKRIQRGDGTVMTCPAARMVSWLTGAEALARTSTQQGLMAVTLTVVPGGSV